MAGNLVTMRGKKLIRAVTAVFGLACLVLSGALPLASCAGGPGVAPEDPARQTDAPPPALVVPSPQETVYTGKPQPLSLHYEGDREAGEPEVIYYPSAGARKENRGGSAQAPVDAGRYFARVIRPAGDNPVADGEVFADYRILKRPVEIRAAETQSATYNGDPKRVQVAAEPEVALSYSYYPNHELLAAAVTAAREAAARGRPSLTETFKGYRRVDRAPIEQGIYYVWIYYPGDKNHESAEAFVEFTIHPPRRGSQSGSK